MSSRRNSRRNCSKEPSRDVFNLKHHARGTYRLMLTLTPHNGEWGFVSGRVSVFEGRLLSPEFFQTLVSHVNVEDVLRQLNETTLREFVRPDAGWEDWSGVIDRYFHAHVLTIRNDCPHPEVADLFIIRDDYQNLKRAVVGVHEFPFPNLYLDPEDLAAVAAGDVSNLPDPFKEAATRALDVLEHTGNRAYVDLVLDGSYLHDYFARAQRLDAPLITAYARDYVLSRAIYALWRLVLSGFDVPQFRPYAIHLGEATLTLRELVAAGGPETWGDKLSGAIGEIFRDATATPDGEEIQRFEDMSMNHLVKLARQGSAQVAGPERVFSYLRALASETHNLKLVVCGRLSAIDPNLLKRRLRKHHD